MLSLLALSVAIAANHLSHKLTDEITRLLMKLIGLFSLFLSLVYALWLIQLLVAAAILTTPGCVRLQSPRRSRCSLVCIGRPICPDASA